MMILFVEARPCPCRVFDANGVELNYVTFCNTETGEVEQFEYKEGEPVVSEDEQTGELRLNRVRAFHPSPLRIVKMNGEVLSDQSA